MENQGTTVANTITEARKPQSRWERWAALIRGQALIGLGVALLIAFAAVTALVLFLDPSAMDLPVTHEVQEFNFAPTNWLWSAISAPGYPPFNYLIPAVTIAVVALFRRYAAAAFLFLAVLAVGAAEVMKVLVHRVRPGGPLVIVVGTPTGYSFPSGHVTEYTLFFGFCFYLAFTLLKRGVLRTVLLWICAIMIILIGPSRIWLGAHWASDVLGGYTLALGLLLLVIWAYRKWEERVVAKPKDESSAAGAKQT
jgi:membrane-associated phospholipid phosphatase